MAGTAFDPQIHCGAKNKKGKPCTRPKGSGTTHSGRGRCKNHGGLQPNDRRLKTGLASNIYKEVAHESLAKSIAAAEKVPLLDLSVELNLLKGMLHDFIRRHQAGESDASAFVERYGSMVNTIIKSDKPEIIAAAIAKLKENAHIPRGGLDMDSAAKLTESIRRVVETIHALQQKSTITVAACGAWAERVAMAIQKHVKDRKALELLLKDLDKIEPPGGWPSVAL
jgi:hypothetical protein